MRTEAGATGGAPDSRAIVHHDRLHANLRAIRARVGPGVALLLPVKADAYGHGAVEVARRAEAAGVVDAFGVAAVSEGVELRAAGVAAPVLKFSPTAAVDLPDALAAGLTLTIATPADLADLRGLLARTEGRAGPVPVHLKVDTGMGRVGVPARSGDEAGAAAVAALAEEIEATAGLRLDGVFTHLAASDTPAQDDFTAAQLAALAAAVAAIEDRIGRRPRWIHAANSGGVLAHPDSWLTLVRPGIMSYGYLPDPGTPPTVPVVPVLEWRARVSQVKVVRAGESVGYGRTWTAPTDTRIATLPVGYADGYDRHLSNRGRVLLGGALRPVVGRVCMDQLMVDLGPADPREPETQGVEVGDEAVLLGAAPAPDAAGLAAQLDTIPYEVLCAIGRRVRRAHR